MVVVVMWVDYAVPAAAVVVEVGHWMVVGCLWGQPDRAAAGMIGTNRPAQ